MQTAEDYKIIEKLKKHGLSATKNRILLLKFFCNHEKAFSVSFLNKYFAKTIDRISLYRTLKLLQIKGFLLKIPDSEAGVAYLFTDGLGKDKNENRDAYFVCTRCRQMTLLDNAIFNSFHINDYPGIKKCHVIIEGECNDCENLKNK